MKFDAGMDLITQRLQLKTINPEWAKSIAAQYNMKEDDVQLVRKGLIASDLQFEEGERAVVSYITTAAKDRDSEIVEPKGAILEDYRKNPVVLFCHDYRQLPIGKNIWIKNSDQGLIAKTVYAPHEEAEKVYQYRKAGFPLAESIGFVPLEWKEHTEDERGKNGGVRRTFTKWLLLEYSDVPVPSNPEALMVAVSKGIIKTRIEPMRTEKEETLHLFCPYCDKEIADGELVNDGIYSYHSTCKDAGAVMMPKCSECDDKTEKPGWEETDEMCRYRVRNPALFQEDSFRTVTIKKDKPRVMAVMGKLMNEDTMTIQNLMFPKEDEWTMDSAKAWLADHQDLLKSFIPEEINEVTKEGRVLSGKNRTLISNCVAGMMKTMEALNDLLDETDANQEEEITIDDDFDLEGIEKDPDIFEIEKEVPIDRKSVV
jgi:hypothetical protein